MQVLRIILSILHHQPRDTAECFGEVDTWFAQGGLFGIDAVDREGQLPAAGLITAAGDYQWVGLVGGVIGLCSQWRNNAGSQKQGLSRYISEMSLLGQVGDIERVSQQRTRAG